MWIDYAQARQSVLSLLPGLSLPWPSNQGPTFDTSTLIKAQHYCVPGDRCFPSRLAFYRFGRTLDGELIQPYQPALPCYAGPDFSADRCIQNRRNWQDPFWIADNPGALMYTQYLGNASLETCPIPLELNTGVDECGKGREPAYSVLAENEQDVQKAIKFAAKHHLRLRVRNTGHDYVGRSSAAGSFTINTHKLKSSKLIEEWYPTCSKGRYDVHEAKKYPPRKAVVVGPALYVQDVYKAAQEYGVTLVGGVSRTVGAAGGWLLGGGHGPLGSRLGMGVDIINAKGDKVIANECRHSDLFWALRGGGAAFGVITEVVFKAHPKMKGVVGMFGAVTVNSEELYAEFLKRYITIHRGFDTAGISAYNYWHYPSSLFAALLPVLAEDEQTLDQAREKAEQAIADFRAWADQTEGVELKIDYAVEEDWYTFYDGPFLQGMGGLDSVGLNLLVSSRLVARSVLLDDGELARLVDTFAAIKTPLIGHFVTSGVISKTDPDSTALNPAFRDSAFIVEPIVSWPSFASQATVDGTKAYLTHITNAISDVSGHVNEPGGYYSEANPDEAAWQSVFWSNKHYTRLLHVKREWDPTGVFSCARCVGSEIHGH